MSTGHRRGPSTLAGCPLRLWYPLPGFASVLGVLRAASVGEDDAGQGKSVVKLQQKGLLEI